MTGNIVKCNIGFLLVLVLLLAACTSVKEQDLYGIYIANYPFGTEKLTLNANGRYKQEVTIKGEPKTLEHQGLWHFAAADNYVELENGLAVQAAFGGLSKDYNVPFDGLVLRKIGRSFPMRHIELIVSEDEDVYFMKIE